VLAVASVDYASTSTTGCRRTCAGEPIVAALEHSILESAGHDLHRDHAGDRGRDLVVLRAEIQADMGKLLAFISSSTL